MPCGLIERWSCANKKRDLPASYHFPFDISYSPLLLHFIFRLFIIVSSCLAYCTTSPETATYPATFPTTAGNEIQKKFS